MLDPAIETFLRERMEARVKSRMTNRMSDEERGAVERQAQEVFDPQVWLPNAARRAGQLFFVTHVAKFSHPDARASALVASCAQATDGILRTGNADYQADVFGNAAALDVYAFLSLKMRDGQTVLQHLEKDCEEIRQQFALPDVDYDELRAGFLAIRPQEGTAAQTSGRLKQVYFPIDESNYHLLSILTPSGLMFEMKRRIDAVRFPDDPLVKEGREARKSGRFSEQELHELYGLHKIGFGGTKPQNISRLNSQSGGTAYLLPCVPPRWEVREVRLPKRDFFKNTVNPFRFRQEFWAFHRKVKALHYSNIKDNRVSRDDVIQEIISSLIALSWQVRSQPPDWSQDEAFAALPLWQKIWLDAGREQQRLEDDDWLQTLMDQMARWFFCSYERVVGRQAERETADPEWLHVRDLVKKIIRQNEGGLR